MEFRIAEFTDLNDIYNIEKNSFVPTRQMTYASLKHSIQAKQQRVYVATINKLIVAYATIFLYKNTHRIYSIAVDKNYRNQGIGKSLMNYLIEIARSSTIDKISLEAEATNLALIKFYESFGFRTVKELNDYYGENEPAFRMHLTFNDKAIAKKKPITNLVVTNLNLPWLQEIENIKIVDAEAYLADEKYQKSKGLRVFNLCSSYQYQSLGYYVSLLASARKQRVIPSVVTIEDTSNQLIIESISEDAQTQIENTLKNIKSNQISLVSYFGYTPIKKYQKLIKSLYLLFESPFIFFTFTKGLSWKIEKAEPLSISEVQTDEFVKEAAIHYFKQKRFNVSRFKDYQYDLAILIDPLEDSPPSDRVALTKFKIAADKIGFFTEFITKDDYHRLREFDALFIRSTTNVNDYTYQFSRYAYREGLIVIDDPWSILKCSNKLFLTESLKNSDVLVPKTLFVSKKTDLDYIINELNFPLILKQPDSAFSMGVFKINTKDDLSKKLDYLLTISDLIVAQAYIQSNYDWRVGILDNKPIFVCKYHMAKNHWQIINYQSKTKKDKYGLVDSLKVEDTPHQIIKSALAATKVMGDGFYGVDLKTVDDKVYVIEVNDNPNVDYRIEDLILGDELYNRIMKSIYERIEKNRNNVKEKIPK